VANGPLMETARKSRRGTQPVGMLMGGREVDPSAQGPGDHPDEPNPRGGVKARDRGDGAARRITPDRSVAMPARGSRVAIR
jgi:hypothetical protein